jgi:hypothetical protein
MTIDKDIDKIKSRLNFYYSGDIPIHITDSNGKYYWGYISSEPQDTFIWILDKREGNSKIYYIDIQKLDYYKGDLNDLPKMQ